MNTPNDRVKSENVEAFLDAYIFKLDADPPAEEPIYEGWLSAGDLAVWVGKEKHRKTNLVLQCAICMALGRNFLNLRYAAPQPLRVVMVDFESKHAMLKRRYEAICGAMGLTQEDREQLDENLKIVMVRSIYREGGEFPRFPVRVKSPEEKAASEFWRRFADQYRAEVYIFDPMRSMHGEEENDSKIEQLLSSLRKLFSKATIIIPHHMSKSDPRFTQKLTEDMRGWSDRARGSGAIKAHCDVIVCQELTVGKGSEVVHWGSFQRSEADTEPIPLMESDYESFYFEVSVELPDHLRSSYKTLRKAGGPFPNKTAAANVLQTEANARRATAFSHIGELAHRGLLIPERDGSLALNNKDVEGFTQ